MTTPGVILIDPQACEMLVAERALPRLLDVDWPMTVAVLCSEASHAAWAASLQQATSQHTIHVVPVSNQATAQQSLPSLRAPDDNAAVIVFTSGTTGHSKAVLLSHRSLIFQSLAKMVCHYVPKNLNCDFNAVWLIDVHCVRISARSLFNILSILFLKSIRYYFHHHVPPHRSVSGTVPRTCMCTQRRSFTLVVCRQHSPCCRQGRCRSSPLVFHRWYAVLLPTTPYVCVCVLRRFVYCVVLQPATRSSCLFPKSTKPMTQGVLHAIQRCKATALIAVPAMVTDLRTAASEPLRTVDRILIGGGIPSSEQLASLRWLFPNARVCTAYGMSEASSSITFDHVAHNNTTSGHETSDLFAIASVVGSPPAGVRVRVSGSGEILTAGPHVMLRYWGDDDATQQAINRHGWLHTGIPCCVN